MERAANTMLSALADARCVGADLRQSDIDIIKTRYLVQIPYALRFTAGQLLPPITGTLNITLDDASVKNGGG